jgi:ribose transport system permease protein
MASVAHTQEAAETRVRPLSVRITLWVGKYGALVVLGILFVYFALTAKYFLTWSNVGEIFNEAALSCIISVGLTVVLIANQFDLSIGYTASLAGIVCAVLLMDGVPAPLAILAAIAVGGITGLINAFLVTRVHVNALVATLGVGSAAVGVNYFISGGAQQVFSIVVPNFTQISIGDWLGVPKDVYYMVAVSAIAWIVINRTVLGRNLQAVGGNAEAARLAGVNVQRVTSIAFVICGLCAALTGVVLCTIVGSGQVTGGDGFTMEAFAAGFLGSAVLREGQFHILGTFVGVIIVALGFDGLTLVGVPSYVQYLFSGILLIAAVSVSSLARQVARSA